MQSVKTTPGDFVILVFDRICNAIHLQHSSLSDVIIKRLLIAKMLTCFKVQYDADSLNLKFH